MPRPPGGGARFIAGAGFWPVALLGIVLFAGFFFFAFNRYLVPTQQARLVLPFALHNGQPEAAAKAMPFPVAAGLKGTVESVSLLAGRLHVEGWAIDDEDPDTKPIVLAFLDNKLIGSTVARVFRPDLLVSFNLKNGSVGFDESIELGIKRLKGHQLHLYALHLTPAVEVNELGYGPNLNLDNGDNSSD
jgi:hypothetical protein